MVGENRNFPFCRLLKVYFVKFLFLCGSALPLCYSVGAMASCNYAMALHYKFRLSECNGKLIEDLNTLKVKACGEILISHPR